ncbi:MAG: MauE/DoxX family redox-associated membrane protein [bacterium]
MACFRSVWSYRALRLFLGMVFIWSGLTKIADPVSFAAIIEAYGLIPGGLSGVAAIGLPLLEIVSGMGLLFDIRGSLLLTAGMLVSFIVILSYAVYSGLDVDCGCFGPGAPEAEAFHNLGSAIVRDLLMIGIIIYLVAWRWFSKTQPIRLEDIIKFNQARQKK